VGISPRRFDGWEPAEVAEHEYDAAGRLVRSVTRREPEWDDDQRALLLGLAAYEEQVCAGCGGWLPDTTDRDADDGYTVDAPTRCHRCTAIGHAAKRYADADQPQALYFVARREAR
jgi:hypothetical protein